jgi:hypothetical protein
VIIFPPPEYKLNQVYLLEDWPIVVALVGRILCDQRKRAYAVRIVYGCVYWRAMLLIRQITDPGGKIVSALTRRSPVCLMNIRLVRSVTLLA